MPKIGRMKREQIIRIASHAAVGFGAAWLVKQFGFKQGSPLAFIIVAGVHELMDAPIAAAIEDAI